MCCRKVIQSITQYRERARTNTTAVEFAEVEVVVWSDGRLVERVGSPNDNGTFHRMTILLNNISPNPYSEYD